MNKLLLKYYRYPAAAGVVNIKLQDIYPEHSVIEVLKRRYLTNNLTNKNG